MQNINTNNIKNLIKVRLKFKFNNIKDLNLKT